MEYTRKRYCYKCGWVVVHGLDSSCPKCGQVTVNQPNRIPDCLDETERKTVQEIMPETNKEELP